MTDTLPDSTIPSPGDWSAVPSRSPGPPPIDVSPASPPAYPPYWLVRRWGSSERDEVGRSIVERAIYVSANATHADHAAAVDIIIDALCRWAHPDDIRWCHLADAGGYTIVGSAMRAVGSGVGDDEDDPDDEPV